MEPEDDGFLGRNLFFFQVDFLLVNTGVCFFFVGLTGENGGKCNSSTVVEDFKKVSPPYQNV